MLSKGRYLKKVKSRERKAKLLSAAAIPAGIIVPVFGGIHVSRKATSLKKMELTEAWGRPKTAALLAKKYAAKNPDYANHLIELGKKPKRMTLKEREAFAKRLAESRVY